MCPTNQSDCPNLQRAPQLYVFVVGSSRGTLSWVWLSGRLISLIACCSLNPLRRGWPQPRQKAPPRNRFQFNNNRFKLLLQRPSIPQLRLTVLTKQGPKKVHAALATSAVQQSTPVTERHIVTWHAVHQTKRLEAGVSLGMLITRIDDVKIE
jgi:hypothetical protein